MKIIKEVTNFIIGNVYLKFLFILLISLIVALLFKLIVKRILKAKTPKQFWHNHANVDKQGKRMWFITPRAGINLRQLFETKTLEFRHFPGTLDNDEMYSCLLWCREFMHAALTTDERPAIIKKKFASK